MHRPLVSVVIPTLSFNDFLRDAVASVLLDGYSPLEILVVLDDVTREVPEYLGTDGVSVLFTGARRGAAAAINIGVREARGEYIARLDADDLTLPGRMAAQVSLLDADPGLVLVGGGATLIDEQGKTSGRFAVAMAGDARETLLKKNPFVHSSVMVARETLLRVGLYDEKCIRMQDYDLLLRLALLGRLHILDSPVVAYRVHGAQSSTRMEGFLPLMRQISRGRRRLAAELGHSAGRQWLDDLLYGTAQYLRYLNLRKPLYLRGLDTDRYRQWLQWGARRS